MPVAPGVPLPARPMRIPPPQDEFVQWTEDVQSKESSINNFDCGATFEERDQGNKKWQVIKNTCQKQVTHEWHVTYDISEWMQLEYTYPPDKFEKMISCEPSTTDSTQIECTATLKPGETVGWVTGEYAYGYQDVYHTYFEG